MSINLTINKGRDLRIAGGINDTTPVASTPKSCAVVADDYHGLTLKAKVNAGDVVAAGVPLLYDKADNDIAIVSPVSGTVAEVVRGERRKIERVVVTPSANHESVKLSLSASMSADEIRTVLKRSGLWAMMRQRPYDIVPEGADVPRDIFVTAIDSAPLAVNPTTFYGSDAKALEAGVAILKCLTKGHVYVSSRPGTLADIRGAENVHVSGPHPAGNAGVQIANIRPVNKGEIVWTLDLATLWRIGRLALDGLVDMTAYVAVTGSEVDTPKVVKTVIGADLSSILADNVCRHECHQRIISGNVLTGTHEAIDGYLRYPWRQVTVIPEGDDVDEFMGWASVSPSKMSDSRSFPGRFLSRIFKPDARINGGRRALIMSGEYDRYLPMDIMAEYLIKAINGFDIERMEQLGIYEVAPEDFALGEWADTSKLETQRLIRQGLDRLRKELQ